MAGFLVYSLSTGGLIRTGTVPDGEELAQASTGEGAMLNNDPTVSGATNWVSLGPPPVLMTKSAMATSINRTYISPALSQTATISGVPQGAEFFVNGVDKGRVDDGSVNFSAASIGTYALLLTHYRYLDQTYSVDVGLARFAAAIETEYAINVAVPLPAAIETETALVAGQLRTTQMTAASEIETALVANMTITVNLAAAEETEQAVSALAPLPPAVETETAIAAVISRDSQLPPATETETALDAAA